MASYMYQCACGQRLILKDEHVGRTGACKACEGKVRITRQLLVGLAEVDPSKLKHSVRSADESDSITTKKHSSTTGAPSPATANGLHPQGIAQAESQVTLEWNVGDVILDLYDVGPVNEDGEASLRILTAEPEIPRSM